ncbi:MAG: TM0996/MTH895 family glutaredoxin-like protein [Gemmataceae bacterium]|nr:TM0996/MTH895 family glutaredoxin-like protein [Gemmataceae bacterium]
MTVQILGTGCSKCGMLFTAAEQAVREAGIEANVEKVADIVRILELAPWALPALAIDGEVKAAGRLLTPEEIKAFFPK